MAELTSRKVVLFFRTIPNRPKIEKAREFSDRILVIPISPSEPFSPEGAATVHSTHDHATRHTGKERA